MFEMIFVYLYLPLWTERRTIHFDEKYLREKWPSLWLQKWHSGRTKRRKAAN